ncbi:hypothetical protein B0J17DRAFT_710037 [Rhizoctonia solani]|nr:hypothetical protein B0J17DRAFT_710037 [Rhizoctonia solani]
MYVLILCPRFIDKIPNDMSRGSESFGKRKLSNPRVTSRSSPGLGPTFTQCGRNGCWMPCSPDLLPTNSLRQGLGEAKQGPRSIHAPILSTYGGRLTQLDFEIWWRMDQTGNGTMATGTHAAQVKSYEGAGSLGASPDKQTSYFPAPKLYGD